MEKGWAKIVNLDSGNMTRKYHYFKEGMSLCAKYMLMKKGDFVEKKLGKDLCKQCSELYLDELFSVA